jgi:hypothetical protein
MWHHITGTDTLETKVAYELCDASDEESLDVKTCWIFTILQWTPFYVLQLKVFPH